MRNAFLAICLLSTVAVGCGQPGQHTIQSTQLNANSAQMQKPLYERTKPNSLPSVGSVNPTSVEIVRKKYGTLKALDVTIRNESSVRQLYSDLRSLGLFPSGAMNCPADFGINYTLTFRSGNKIFLVANADPNGCQAIKLSTEQTLWGVEQVGKPFWTLLAKSIGLPNDSYLGGAQVSD